MKVISLGNSEDKLKSSINKNVVWVDASVYACMNGQGLSVKSNPIKSSLELAILVFHLYECWT